MQVLHSGDLDAIISMLKTAYRGTDSAFRITMRATNHNSSGMSGEPSRTGVSHMVMPIDESGSSTSCT